MAKKAKGNRVQVILECTEIKQSGMPGTSRYITTKNRKNTPERMELMKYNPILKKMTLHNLDNLRISATTSLMSRWFPTKRLRISSRTKTTNSSFSFKIRQHSFSVVLLFLCVDEMVCF